MGNQQLTVLARIRAAKGKEEELYNILTGLVTPTRSEGPAT